MEKYNILEDTTNKYEIDSTQELEEINNYYNVDDESVVVVDPVKQYLEEIGRVPLLSEEEEIKIANRIYDLRLIMRDRQIISVGAGENSKDKDIDDKNLKKKLIVNGINNVNNLCEVPNIIHNMLNESSLNQEKRSTLQTLLTDVEIFLDYQKLTKKFAESNLRLSASIAKKYSAVTIIPFLDLIQEGNIGLKKAIDRFDVSKGYKFSTYATWWIRQSITRYIADASRTIRVPVHYHEVILKVIRFQNDLEMKLGRTPTENELVDAYNNSNGNDKNVLTPEKLKQIRKISQGVVSLQTPVGEEEDSILADFIESDDESVEEITFKKMHKDTIIKLLCSLNTREKIVILLRFGLPLEIYISRYDFINVLCKNQDYSVKKLNYIYDRFSSGNIPLTLEKVGDFLGITRERVRQIEAKALRRLRLPSNNNKIKSLLKG